jgi:methionyl-tRNA synthetase
MDVTDPITGVTNKVSMESGHKVTWLTEPNYMFKMSEFREKLLEWIAKEHPIHPPGRKDEIVADLERGLRDLSVSRIREKIPWGIPVPTDPAHVIYVWLDALTNYLTVTGFPDAPDWKRLWPADYHIVGKDIIKFHTIYWPSFLVRCSPQLLLTPFETKLTLSLASLDGSRSPASEKGYCPCALDHEQRKNVKIERKRC